MENGQPAEITTDRFSHGSGAVVRKGVHATGQRFGKFGRMFRDLKPLETTE